LALRVGTSLAPLLPAPLVVGVAEAATVAVYRVASRLDSSGGTARRRRLAGRHLERVTGVDPRSSEGRRLVAAMLRSYARYWAETLQLPGIDPERLGAGISYQNLEAIESALEQGRGVVVALPHLGGWEWAGADMARRGFGVTVVVEPLADPEVFEWFCSLRSQLGMEVVPLGPHAFSKCVTALKANRVLCLLSDRLVGGSAGVEVEFFGERTALPAGPASLAIRCRSPLVSAAVYFEPWSQGHKAVVSDPLRVPSDGSFRAQVAELTQRVAQELERLIVAAPTQWHLLAPNWPSDCS